MCRKMLIISNSGECISKPARRIQSFCLMGALCVLSFSSVGFAQTAGMLNFQGLIKDGGGVPINVGVTLQFRLYDASAGGSLVDMDGDGVVEDVVGQDAKQVAASPINGVVSTKFGPVFPAAFDGSARWLEVRVNGTPLSRIEMPTAPAVAERINRPGTSAEAVHVDSTGNVGIGTTAPAAKLDVNGSISGFGVVPIGAVIAWHKNLAGVPALPEGWLESNGQVVTDPSSPLNGQTLPNLNGEGRFLRGAASSGMMQSGATKLPSNPFMTDTSTHNHTLKRGGFGGTCSAERVETAGTANSGCGADDIPLDPNNHSHLITGGGDSETRPVNMSVVWIIRVK